MNFRPGIQLQVEHRANNMNQKIKVEQDEALTVATFVDPEMRNAISRELRIELEAIIDAFVEAPSSRCLLLTGSGGFFSAGGDVRSFQSSPPPGANRTRLANSHRLAIKMLNCEKPIVAAVNGPAVGAGFGLAMLCDITLAAESAFFQPAFSAIGLAPDWGLAKTLPAAVGAKRAARILLSNARIAATEAAEIGLISGVHPDDMLEQQARKLASRLSQSATFALGLAKSLMKAATHLSMEDFLLMEASYQAIAMGSPDHKEGIGAFLEKRPAVFKGE
jgi:2-(1,2-epoxy-1,2-dihydrophenyl)acetyl-CoA isomerase